jgi:glucosamine-6-phosphate isomerase
MHKQSTREGTYSIGVDVGGTKCAAGLVDVSSGRVFAWRLKPTEPERGGEAVLDDAIAIARLVRDEGAQNGQQAAAIGVCVAELVDSQGRVLSDATIRWKGMDIRARIQQALSLPAQLDADVRAAALGEARFGAGRGSRSFLYVTVGTGISACLVIDGTPYVGARGLTGTFASNRALIPGDNGELHVGPPLESFASGPALATRFAAVSPRFSGRAPDVLAATARGDERAKAVVESAGRSLGAAIAHLVNVLDPERVVIGGGLGLAGGLYRESLEQSLREFIWSDLHRDLPLVSAELGLEAGVIGAAIGAVQRANAVVKSHPSPNLSSPRRVSNHPGGERGLQVEVLDDHEAMSRQAAEWLVDRIRKQPDVLLCLATGATPMRTYELLAVRGRTEPQLFSRMRVIKLDEWGGLAMSDPASCERHLRDSLIDPLRLHDRYIAFNSEAADGDAECKRIADWLAENGPIDIAVLGLGVNGHIGFNEPADFLQPHAHVASLAATSMQHSMLAQSKNRPTHGLTLGMADLLQSREVLLLVSGEGKRAAMGRLLEGRVTTDFPATFLALHPNACVMCDRAACLD